MEVELKVDDLTIPQGVDFGLQWPLLNRTTGLPIDDFTGWFARAQVRETADTSGDPLYEWTTENGGIVLAYSSLTLIFKSGDTSAWQWRRGEYDIEIVSPVPEVSRVTGGKMTVSPEVTR